MSANGPSETLDAKKTYVPPVLVEYGGIAKLTMGRAGGSGDARTGRLP